MTLTQETYNPDMIDWEVDEDLRRARLITSSGRAASRHNGQILRFESRSAETSAHALPESFDGSMAVESHTRMHPSEARSVRFDQPAESLRNRRSRSSVRATSHQDTPVKATERVEEYPPSPFGRWRPWLFATAGFVGGHIAMTLGGVSPKYLPTIIIGEIVLGVLVCITFYPRRQRSKVVA